ncbi:MAG: hypothetical protein A2Y62_03435 [Candidatus Fischerbacteria bacterium RBG_13_37_8]|uniref:Guanylate cyclase domain-containing protein n=1 Tax=Candidatus Fischerbacteria bacterium RBG_13_37_8 TaxID=1817863 RepID=A0A1F5VK89_9BACT|nr:MAG: hypothetical protein A2Y62_03435 [Candidatus Fischerbacteria bacterium RBG_13_37_8]
MIRNCTDSHEILEQILKTPKEHIVHIITTKWREHPSKDYKWALQLYQTAGTKMLEFGQTFTAYDILEKGLEFYPRDRILLQQMALALARLGKTKKAKEKLEQLYNRGDKSPDTLGILARTYKDLWKKTIDETKRREFLENARDIYMEGFRANKNDEYTGINAASMSFLLGDNDPLTEELAKRVVDICKKKHSTDFSSKYWTLATLGEAYLVLGNCEKAFAYYQKAFNTGKFMHANKATTIQQARLLFNLMKSKGACSKEEIAEFEKLFSAGNIVFCVGHMIDRPGRKTPRFPPHLETEVKNCIKKAIAELDAVIGYCSAACGTDIIFAEEMLRKKAELHVHLPFRREDFIQTSIKFAEAQWEKRFHNVLKKASTIIEPVTEAFLNSDCLFGFGNKITIGKILLHAETLGITPTLLVVWDKQKGDGPYGTSDIVDFWKKHFHENLYIIDITELQPKNRIHITKKMYKSPSVHNGDKAKELKRSIMSMLFADTVGYSRIIEEQLPFFMHKFMGAIGDLANSKKYKPTFKATWGDGLYCVFNSVSDAAYFALELRDLVQKTDWEKHGLPKDTSMRIALHAGPIYFGRDPITGQVNYYGSHVSHTARIEPVTLPGTVYASESFAALLRASRIPELICEYIGKHELYKDYGIHPIYLLRRWDEIE